MRAIAGYGCIDVFVNHDPAHFATVHSAHLYSQASRVLQVFSSSQWHFQAKCGGVGRPCPRCMPLPPATTRLSSDRTHGAYGRWPLHCRPPCHVAIGFARCGFLLIPALCVHATHEEPHHQRKFSKDAEDPDARGQSVCERR